MHTDRMTIMVHHDYPGYHYIIIVMVLMGKPMMRTVVLQNNQKREEVTVGLSGKKCGDWSDFGEEESDKQMTYDQDDNGAPKKKRNDNWRKSEGKYLFQ